MKTTRPARLYRLARRKSVRVTLGLALGLPFVVFALPRVVPFSWRTAPPANTPFVKLESLWRSFEVEHDVSASTIDDLLGVVLLDAFIDGFG